MIVLDTNVVSELMRATPSSRVLEWFRMHPATMLHVTAITVAEIHTGIALLPRGARRERLDAAARQMFAEDFADRCASFDAGAAEHYADIVVRRTRAGKPIAAMDAQIGAIARSRRATLATRNTSDFDGCGVTLEDPSA
jgi:predicted nucleic acid-binding protein